MKKNILSILITSLFSFIAFAVDVNTAQIDDPQKAEESLISKDINKKKSIEERRNELKTKHKRKKELKALKKHEVKKTSGDISEASTVFPKEEQRALKIQEHKEEKAPNKQPTSP